MTGPGDGHIQSPLASDGIQLVFGTEWRRDTLKNTVDAIQEVGGLGGSGGPTIGISGGTKVEELFMEAATRTGRAADDRRIA